MDSGDSLLKLALREDAIREEGSNDVSILSGEGLFHEAGTRVAGHKLVRGVAGAEG